MNIQFKFALGQSVRQISLEIAGTVTALYVDESGALSVTFKYVTDTGEIKTRWEFEDALSAI